MDYMKLNKAQMREAILMLDTIDEGVFDPIKKEIRSGFEKGVELGKTPEYCSEIMEIVMNSIIVKCEGIKEMLG